MAIVLNGPENFLCVYAKKYTHGMTFFGFFFPHKVTTYIHFEIGYFK